VDHEQLGNNSNVPASQNRKLPHRQSLWRLDPERPAPLQLKFTVTQIFDLINFFSSPAGARWAVLFYVRSCGAKSAGVRFPNARME